MVISSKSNGNSSSISVSGGTKRKSKVPVSTSFSGLSKPRKPRGPRTPYNFFFADERAKMGEAESQQDAAATMAAIKQGGGTDARGVAVTLTSIAKPKPTFETTKARNREIAKKWRHFAQMQKLLGDNDLMKSYRAMAAEDEIRYKNEMAEYLDDVEAYNDAEAEAEQEFIQIKKRVIADAHAKHGRKKKKARVEENDSSTTAINHDDEALIQSSFSGSPANNAGTSSNTNKDQEPIIRARGDDAAAAAMTNMASGLGLHRTPLQNRIHPGPPRAAVHHPGAPTPLTSAHAAASPYYMHGAAAPPPPPQYHHPNMPYCYPGGMYTMPHMAHPPTLNALMAQRAGEAAAVHMPPSLPAQAVDDRVSASMAYLQGYAAACSAMIDRKVSVAPPPAAAAAAQPAPAQGQQQPSTSVPTRSDLEKAIAVAGPVPTAAKVAAPSSTEEDAALLEESPLTQKKVDMDIFVARRRQGQKTTEE